eukprot:190498_1
MTSGSTLCLFYLIVSGFSQTCDEPYSCVGQSMSPSDYFMINGYKAAIGPSTSFSGPNQISCRGAYACNSMQFIQSDASVDCKGSASCSNTTINLQRVSIFCYGFRTCAFSILTSKSNIACYGEQSCAYTRIQATNLISAGGSYSLYGSIIESQGVDSIVGLRGTLAGYGAKLICSTGDLCRIECYAYDSCYMFHIECHGTCVVNATGIAPTTDITQLNSTDIHYTSTINTEHICNTFPNASLYDNSNERRDSEITSDKPLCCRGSYACGDSDIDYMVTDNALVVCSGGFSCMNGNIYANNASVFCEAGDSCMSSTIHNASRLYCWGFVSCKFSTIIASQSVVCSAKHACMEATIYSGGYDLDLYFTGQQSGATVTIYCNETDSCNIQCGGWLSCAGTTLFCFGVCRIDCNINSECPIQWTPTPTIHPTIHPTNAPTIIPTIRTNYPTIYPTIVPTNIPTSMPLIRQSTSLNPYTTSSRLNSNYSIATDWISIMLVIVISSTCIAICIVIVLCRSHGMKKNMTKVVQKLSTVSEAELTSGEEAKAHIITSNNAELQFEVHTMNGPTRSYCDGVLNGGPLDENTENDLIPGINTLGEGDGGYPPPVHVPNAVAFVDLASKDEVIVGDDETVTAGKTIQ